MTQMDINFCILLFYIVLRNVMAFDKEIAILYRFFNLKISKKAALVENVPMGPKTFFLYIYIYIYQNVCNFEQNYQIFCFKSIWKCTFSPGQIYT